MELYRDGELIDPIHPGKGTWKMSQSNIEDIAYYGQYSYPPEAFAPDSEVILMIWEEDRSKARVENVPKEVLRKIWHDFIPYFDELETMPAAHIGQRVRGASRDRLIRSYMQEQSGWATTKTLVKRLHLTDQEVLDCVLRMRDERELELKTSRSGRVSVRLNEESTGLLASGYP